MEQVKDSKIDDLTETLLKKCEVSSLKQLYFKWVNENEHKVTVKKICAIHKNFNEDKVLFDVKNIPNLLIVSLMQQFRPNGRERKLIRIKYLVDLEGLLGIIKAFKRKKHFKKSIKLMDLIKKLGIIEDEKEQVDKVLNMIQKAINNTIIYAKLSKIVSPESSKSKKSSENDKIAQYTLNFYSRLKHPKNKKELIKLIITIIAAIASLSVLIPIIYIINA